MSTISGVPRRPVVLIILDGFGVNPAKLNNAVAEAHTPNLDAYFSRYPHTTLNASGHAVGLPEGQMGNSEVGHLTLGAGTILRQDMVKISDAIDSGAFFSNPALLAAVSRALVNKRPLHILGLVSDGGVHSKIDHLKAMIRLAREHGVRPLLHMITDGRDTAPHSAQKYLREIEPLLHQAGGAVASIMGRYYAMDRDTRWERTEKTWRALVLGKGEQAQSAHTAIRAAYHRGDSDEFIQPILLPAFCPIEQDDPVVVFNFRKDRPRQLVAALGDPDFKGFDRGTAPLAAVTCMMPYDRSLGLPYAFEPEAPKVTLAQLLSNMGLSQFHCAETEKYAHVTYFFNGGRTTPWTGETQLLIPSPKVATYDLKPEMSSAEIADAMVAAISQGRYAFMVANFASGDMVGHTANRSAILQAVESLDREVSRVLEAAENAGYSVVLTADHGNCEQLVDPFTGEPHTQHTTYPVPCLILDEDNWQLSDEAGLASVAQTVLQLMGLPPVSGMQPSLLLKKSSGKRRPPPYSSNHLRVA